MSVEPNHGFRWRQASWGDVLECVPLAEVALHFFTTRSIAPASPRTPAADGWERIASEAGVPLSRFCRLEQVHGSGVYRVRHGRQDSFDLDMPVADVAISDDPAVAVSVRVADCVPLLVADRRSRAVAAAHAGWRGTAAHVVRTTVEALADAFGSRPGDLVAAVGPSIGGCCYQVGPEVRNAFAAAGHPGASLDRWFSGDRGDRLRLDLWKAVVDQLQATGVPMRSIHLAGFCTATHIDRFFSFRAEGAAAGRLVAVIRAGGSSSSTAPLEGSAPPAV